MRVIVESPFKAETKKLGLENLIYANMVARHLTLKCNYSPLFFHTFYTQFLDDDNAEERLTGLEASFTHHDYINKRIVTLDRGITEGMKKGVENGLEIGCMPVLFSLSTDKGLQKAVRHLNETSCPIKRWEQIQGFCSDLKRVDDLGNFTNYSEERRDLREEVCSILGSHLLPMLQHLI